MSSTQESSVRTVRQDHTRYPKEPIDSQQPFDHQLYLSRAELQDCKCDVHRFESDEIRYARLADKERRLRDELTKINREMKSLASAMLDCTSERRDSPKSIYKTDYEKKNPRPMKTAVVSPTQPCGTPTIDLENVYKDPFEFRYSAMEMIIPPVKPTCLSKVSESRSFWDKPFAGESEYTDEISKMGLSNIRNQQCYLHPLLSAKGKSSGCDL